MMSIGFVLLLMLFCHIVDDYYLQGILASMKQKEWWQKNAPGELYENDYCMALIMHGFSWSFMVHLPVAIYLWFDISWLFIISVMFHSFVHATIDNGKANRKTINLITDQCLHMCQIAVIFGTLLMMEG